MNERIQQFLDVKGLTGSEFADQIGVQRSNVTHVLHGRNKPSFQFIEKMLKIYPEINAKWLILGDGPMVDSPDSDKNTANESSDSNLWNQTQFDIPQQPIEKQLEPERKTIEIKKPTKDAEPDQFLAAFKHSPKAIERIVVFYKDQTFSQYTPSN